ncbi:Arsenate reductase and related proteins, glutaredoxin family [Cedecea davisae]|uniref:Metallo-beta-lactamase domain protein n=2 Tax=Cedecea davisae TaxID=158484 RepID=S3IWU9_9ENTR|nr:Vmh family MBL fold metallo-hydrolase [Cedecea davisae]EPF18208.1 metallo-beta-lactamase domain protein [Cedecea davisae DSM 4568]MBU4682506.1 MBL fold metallo-hydrolase [Cedecea davisae]MBU4688060.1 MBL fold metallo-hydrolase [Cedecea davisae]SUX28129.1 Arsenate reductase and related proteins, glutaredoxin family [Cedecea davisae]
MKKHALAAAISTLVFSGASFAAPLTLEVYNPQDKGVFPVTSTLISGPTEATLVDAQFSVKDGAELVKIIQHSGKKLTRILITAGDPDFYFGLEPIVKAWPDVKIEATPLVVEHINKTKDAKIKYWGPILKDGAPQKVFVPQVTHATTFTVDGEKVELRQPASHAAYLWIPANKTILGGVAVDSGIHVWTADSQTKAARQEWRDVLDEMAALKPERVIPGHFIGEVKPGTAPVVFTGDYLADFELALKKGKSAPVIAEMKQKYPKLADESSLEMSAKVNTGEMKW